MQVDRKLLRFSSNLQTGDKPFVHRYGLCELCICRNKFENVSYLEVKYSSVGLYTFYAVTEMHVTGCAMSYLSTPTDVWSLRRHSLNNASSACLQSIEV